MKNRDGFTMTEAVVAGAVLILVSLIAVQGFMLSSRLVQRSDRLREQEQALEFYVAEDGRPSESREVTLTVGEDGAWTVKIETYRAEIEGRTIVLKALGR